MPPSRPHSERHLVVVDAYAGFLEHLTDESGERAGALGLGLPLEEIAERLDCRVTLLDWSLWYEDEGRPESHARWMPFPATRPLAWSPPGPPAPDPFAGSARVRRRPVPAQDPDRGRPFAAGLSPRSLGLLAESDPLMLASFVLERHLVALHRADPIGALVLPQFGGLGYVAQMARATGAALAGIPAAVVVTGRSAERQQANGEGLWTRPAQTRRQMEDVSLGLADLALCFGPRGEERARRGAPAGPVVLAPRRVPGPLLDAVAAAADSPAVPEPGPLRLRLEAPRQAASGALVLLDAVRALQRAGRPPAGPVACLGADMTFGPNLPRDFRGYWSSRGWVREMRAAGLWSWDAPPGDGLALRLRPSLWEHLPSVWDDLARGGAVLLSPEAAEGLAPGAVLPALARLDADPTPEGLADRLARIGASGPNAVDAARRELCRQVVAAHRGEARARRLEATVAGLGRLLDGPVAAPRLDRALRRLLDRRPERPAGDPDPPPPLVNADPTGPALTVAVACHEMGALVVETVESIWASSRMPDELLLIDDGSTGAATAEAIAGLERAAAARHLPLTVIRQENRGLSGARNRALEAARGAYVSFLDGDDLIDPGFYRLALDMMRANPGLGGVAAWAETFGEGVPPGFWNAPQPELPLLLAENVVFVPVLWPTALLRELGGYDGRQRYNYEDWELPVRVLASGWPIATIPRYLQRYRVRADSLLRTMSDVQNQVMREQMFRTHRATVERFGPELAAMLEHRLMRNLDRLARAERGALDALDARAALHALGRRAKAGVGRSARRWAARARGLARRPGPHGGAG